MQLMKKNTKYGLMPIDSVQQAISVLEVYRGVN